MTARSITARSGGVDMSELISRQDAIDAICGITPYKGTIPLGSAIFNIQKVPSAERVGEWIFKTTDAYIERICSACRGSERMYHRNRNQDGLIRNYCPDCGAKMVSKEDKRKQTSLSPISVEEYTKALGKFLDEVKKRREEE